MNKINTFLISLLVYILTFSYIFNTSAVEMIISNNIISNAKNDQDTPLIAYNNKKNEYLVVWNDERNKNITGKDIFAKILDSKLETKKDEFPINAFPNDQYVMDIDYNNIDDQYLIVWNDETTGNIQGQIVSSSGDLLGDKINIANSVRSHTSLLAFNSIDNNYLVIWDEGDISQNSSNIYGQMLSRNGMLLGGKSSITASAFNQYNPVIAHNNNDNEFLVVWQDERNSVGDVKCVDIYCKRLTGLGQLISGDIPISNISDDNYEQLPSVAYNKAKNEYLIAWTQGKIPSSMDIYGRLVKNNGIMEGDVITLCSAYGKQSNPDIAYNDVDMEYLIVWEDTRGANPDIYGQKLSQTGQLLYSNFAISTAPEKQDYPKIIFNSIENNYLVVWNDNRNQIVNAGDIYAQIINSPSLLLEIKPNILYADGKSTADITLTLKGIFGEPLDREYVDIKVTKGQGTVSNITNNNDGTYTAVYTASSQIGMETITVTALNKTKSVDITLIGSCRKGDVNGDGVVSAKDAI
ncbi:MAG: invasin domain 3-containing protein, partial [Candidatus Poribacteria bacterium]